MTEGDAIVFVVEDDASIRGALQRLLGSMGLQVETFASAREFLQRQGADVPGGLVLAVCLPGLSGFDLQRELAEAQITIPTIFITGHGNSGYSMIKFFVLDVLLRRVVAVSSDPAPDSAFAPSFFGRSSGQLP